MYDLITGLGASQRQESAESKLLCEGPEDVQFQSPPGYPITGDTWRAAPAEKATWLSIL